MSNYAQTTFFAPKDALLSGNPAKIIKGGDVDPELAAISVAIATKYDSANSASAPITFANGTAGLPSITFASQTNTGFYRAGASDIGISVNGVEVADFQAATIALFNSVIAGLASLALTNTSTTATQDMQAQLTAGSSVATLFVANQNRATAVVTGGPTTAQAALYTSNSIPLVFGTNGALAATITTNQVIQTKNQLEVSGNGTLAAAYGSSIALSSGEAGSKGRLRFGDGSGWSFIFTKRTGSADTDLFSITDSGAISARGTVAAALVDMTPDSGSYTGTLTGCTTAPTVTISWRRVGALVSMTIPALTAVSNATACTITGSMPASIQPASTQAVSVNVIVDNATEAGGTVLITGSSSTLTLQRMAAAAFTNTGTKGWARACTFYYLLV